MRPAQQRPGDLSYNPAVKDRVYLVSESFYSIDPLSVGSWLDKKFIVPGDLKEIDQAAWSNNPGWKVIRDDPKADWRLENPQSGEILDKSFAQSLSNFAPSFTDVRPASASPDETGLNNPFQIRIKTFDGFTYDLLLGKQGPDKTRYLQLRVSADLPSVRTPDPKESQEDKKKKDEEFDKRNADLKQRLEKETGFEKWVFLVPDWSLEQILKRRDEIVSKASPSPIPPGATPSPISSTPSPRPEDPPHPHLRPRPPPHPHPAPAKAQARVPPPDRNLESARRVRRPSPRFPHVRHVDRSARSQPRQVSDGRVPCSALDGRCAPARPALHFSTRQ